MNILLEQHYNISDFNNYSQTFPIIFRTFLVALLMLCGVSFVYIAGKKASEQQKWLQLTLFGFLMTLLSYFCEITSTNIDMMLLVIKAGHIFKALSTVCFLKYTSNYCRVESKFIKVYMLCYYVLVTFLCTCIVFADRGTFFYKSYDMEYLVGIPYFHATYGIIFYIFSYSLCAAIFVVLFMIIKRMVKVNESERKRLRFLFGTGLVPVLGYFLSVSLPLPVIDFVPISFGISAFLLFVASKQHGLLDVVLSAKESIIENTKEGVIVVDNEYNVLYANFAVSDLIDNIHNYKTGEELENFKKLFEKEKTVLEIKNRMYEISVSDIYENRKIRGKMAWLFDVTESQNYTKEILRLKDEAEQANQAKTAFLANMSHEIRTPMNAILGFAELVIQEEKQEKIKDYMYDIKNSAKNLLHIINQILDISKIESGKIEIVEEEYFLQALLEDVMTIISSQAKNKGLNCRTVLGNQIPAKLYGAVVQIREILINILNNSVKYTKEGSVILHVDMKQSSEDYADFCFEIVDTGVGMKKEDVDRIYDRFRKFDSMKNQGIEGSGLGMYIVKNLVTSLHGTIDISSVYGEGTTVKIVIPQTILDHTPIGKLDVKHKENAKDKKSFIASSKILVVDDNEVNLKLIAGLLSKYKIHPDMALDGESGIQKLMEKTYDLIYMDHMMPGMDGVETMLKIRELDGGKYEKLPIILLTANAIAGVREEMLAKGFQDYISKPIDVQELENSLLKYLPKDSITYMENDLQNISEANEQDHASLNEIANVLKHFQIEEGIKNCGGHFADYRDILHIVEKHGTDRVEELKRLIEQKDYEKYTINAHSLKSTAYNIGAMELGDEAKAHEMAGKHGNYEYINQHFEVFIEEYQIVLLEIKKWLHIHEEKKEDVTLFSQDIDQIKQTELKNDDMETISEDEQTTILDNVRMLLEEFEIDKVVTILTELVDLVGKPEDRKKIQDAMGALEQFDVEKAKEILHK